MALLIASFSTTSHAQIFWSDSGGAGFNAYIFFEEAEDFTFDEARYYATQFTLGENVGHLATIQTAGENTFISGTGTTDLWIGYTDHTGTSTLDGFDYSTLGTSDTGAGGWRWVNGEAVGYTNWNGGEPNGGGGTEDAAEIQGSGGWNDVSHGASLGDTDTRQNSAFEISVGATMAGSPTDAIGLGNMGAGDGGAGFVSIREVRGNGQIDNITDVVRSLAQAEAGLNAGGAANIFDGTATSINFADPDNPDSGNVGGDSPFLSNTGADDQDFVAIYNGFVKVENAGIHTFAVDADDEIEFILASAAFTKITGSPEVDADFASRIVDGSGTSNGVFETFLNPGVYDFRLLFAEDGGGAGVEVLAGFGEFNADFGGVASNIPLFGSGGVSGLSFVEAPAPVPEPSSIAIWCAILAVAAGMGWRNRRRRN